VVGARRGRSPSGGESYLRGGLVTGQLLVTASRIVTSVRIRLGPGPRVDPLDSCGRLEASRAINQLEKAAFRVRFLHGSPAPTG